jgi:hypothetical protein
MRKWLLWAGIAFIVGGAVSLAMTLSVEELLPREDLSGYSIGWILAGVAMIAVGFVLKS